jgi:hypothetical protein
MAGEDSTPAALPAIAGATSTALSNNESPMGDSAILSGDNASVEKPDPLTAPLPASPRLLPPLDAKSPVGSPAGPSAELAARMGDADDRVLDIDAVIETGKDVDLTETSYKTQYAVSHLRVFFDLLDVNKDGFLSQEEVTEGATKVGMSKEETENFFAMLDRNNDGVLDYNEFKRSNLDKDFVNMYLSKATPKATDEAKFFAAESLKDADAEPTAAAEEVPAAAAAAEEAPAEPAVAAIEEPAAAASETIATPAPTTAPE